MTLNLQSRQYRRLMDELGGEVGKRFGWQSNVARKLGISDAFLCKIFKDVDRGVGISSVNRAVSCLGISPDYFHKGSSEGQSYRLFLNTASDQQPDTDAPDSNAEFDVMRALGQLDEAAARRVIAWGMARFQFGGDL